MSARSSGVAHSILLRLRPPPKVYLHPVLLLHQRRESLNKTQFWLESRLKSTMDPCYSQNESDFLI